MRWPCWQPAAPREIGITGTAASIAIAVFNATGLLIRE
jgi:CO/xanthine dehydrogenase Mo-binding subunit